MDKLQLLGVSLNPRDTSFVALGLAGTLVWLVTLAIYRLYFHPLSKFPGPKIAAVTLWYETYHDVWRRGKYVYKVKEMHEKYGPIVRINPHEIHIDDPDFYHEFYSSSKKLKKYPWYYKVSGVSDVSFGTEDHEAHRQRIGLYRNLFALRSIYAFEPNIKLYIQKLCRSFDNGLKTGAPLNVSHAFRCLTSDTITSYIGLGHGPLLDDANLGKSYRAYARIVTESSVMARHFPFVAYFQYLPSWLVTRLSSRFGILKAHLDRLAQQVALACDGKIEREDTPHTTMISGIIGNEKHTSTTRKAITEEALILEGGGTDSTAQALEAATFYILNDPNVSSRLREELIKAIPDPNNMPPLPKLREIKYLNAVINETLRISSPASSRFPRVNDSTPTIYKGWEVPVGTPISMNIWNTHYNKDIFPDPTEFRPDRWMGESTRELEKYLVPFGSGSRMCIGQNLSIAEQVLTIATLFRNYELELYETTSKDVVMASSCMISLPGSESPGIQVTVRKMVQ
ncbi:cytochrome P450 [Aspergillus floccosus]